MRTRAVIFAWLAIGAVACGLSVKGTGAAIDDGNPDGAAGNGDNEGGADGAVGVGDDAGQGAGEGGTASDAGVADADAASLAAPIFGITADTLYRFDPNAAVLTKVGPLAGCTAPTDIALDANGVMFLVGDALYTVDHTTGTCTQVVAVAQPFTLTFVPKGTVNANQETLTAFLSSDYVRINRATGVNTAITELAIDPYQPSGDVASGIGTGTYVSVTDTSCATDCILEVDPTAGTIVKNWGASGSVGVYGLALSGGVLYGFLGTGEIVRFTFAGATVTSTIIPLGAKPVWVGAGSSTVQYLP